MHHISNSFIAVSLCFSMIFMILISCAVNNPKSSNSKKSVSDMMNLNKQVHQFNISNIYTKKVFGCSENILYIQGYQYLNSNKSTKQQVYYLYDNIYKFIDDNNANSNINAVIIPGLFKNYGYIVSKERVVSGQFGSIVSPFNQYYDSFIGDDSIVKMCTDYRKYLCIRYDKGLHGFNAEWNWTGEIHSERLILNGTDIKLLMTENAPYAWDGLDQLLYKFSDTGIERLSIDLLFDSKQYQIFQNSSICSSDNYMYLLLKEIASDKCYLIVISCNNIADTKYILLNNKYIHSENDSNYPGSNLVYLEYFDDYVICLFPKSNSFITIPVI